MPEKICHDDGDVGTSSANELKDKRSPLLHRLEQRAVWPRSSLNGKGPSEKPRPFLGSRHISTTSLTQLTQLLSNSEARELESYGIKEIRHGFFDSSFLKPLDSSRTETTTETGKSSMPAEFDKHSPLTLKYFLPKQWHELKSLVRRVARTRIGIQLLKAFVSIYVAYILCLIPSVRDWLGQYHYIMVVSVLVNHPARSLGSQLDGAVLTVLGTAAGIAWGAIGLLLSTSSPITSDGYDGVLVLFLALLISSAAWIRAFYIRFYQAVLCAGVAMIFASSVETDRQNAKWDKLKNYIIPWLLGQALALLVNLAIFPDAGTRPIAASLHKAFTIMSATLEITGRRNVRQRRQLVQSFVDISQMYRDMVMEVTISRYKPKDVLKLRNLMQAVIRSLLAIEPATHLLENGFGENQSKPASSASTTACTEEKSNPEPSSTNMEPISISMLELTDITRLIVRCMKDSLEISDAVLLEIAGSQAYLLSNCEASINFSVIQVRLTEFLSKFDASEASIISQGTIHNSDKVAAFVFSRHVRQAAATVRILLKHIELMRASSNQLSLHLPSYSFAKSVHRTNAQIRHDRGGVVAGSYQATFREIDRAFSQMSVQHDMSENFAAKSNFTDPETSFSHVSGLNPTSQHPNSNKNNYNKSPTIRRKIWQILYRLQGYESKYALKACIVTLLLSVPSYLDTTKWWWDKYEAWWAVVMSWIVMHPRVGGNIQDFANRSVLAIFGAVWAGAAYSAGNGDPYVLAAFAFVYLLPMVYRFTQSSHPRSGLVACLSFIVVSLTLSNHDGDQSTHALHAVIKGVVFFVGTAAPILINWILWPFVARHELRFALSTMLFYMSILYRDSILSYSASSTADATSACFDAACNPDSQDIQKSELLEGRLREGFVRIRQLLVLTRHETRLRAAFDPIPYSGLAESCEQFFEHVIAVRQSARFYKASHDHNSHLGTEELLGYNRDAVAAIIANLYILAGALRSQRRVPRYLPSAAAARKKLIIETQRVEQNITENNTTANKDVLTRQEWSDVYRYSYDQSLTGCAVLLDELERYTKSIVGEQGFDDHFTNENTDINDRESY